MWVVGGNDQADHEERDDVETCDAPKHLFGGGWERLSRVSGLSSGKTDKLGTAESKGSVDKDGAESLKPVSESARIVPVMSTEVSAVEFGVDTSAVNHNGENDETYDGCNFDGAEDELDC